MGTSNKYLQRTKFSTLFSGRNDAKELISYHEGNDLK